MRTTIQGNSVSELAASLVDAICAVGNDVMGLPCFCNEPGLHHDECVRIRELVAKLKFEFKMHEKRANSLSLWQAKQDSTNEASSETRSEARSEMMHRICRCVLAPSGAPVTGAHSITTHGGAEILAVGLQDGHVCLWVRELPDAPRVNRNFLIVESEQMVADEFVHIGLVHFGDMALHVLEMPR